jgi:hypothetical protein
MATTNTRTLASTTRVLPRIANNIEAPPKNPVRLVGHKLKPLTSIESQSACLLLIVCHLLNTLRDFVITSFSFQWFPDGESVALLSCVGVRLKK